MLISPNSSRGYDEIIQAYQNKYQINIEELIKDYLPSELILKNHGDKSSFLILKSILAINIMEYNQLLIEGNVDERILFLYKLIIYDYYDYCQACNTFCGIQIYSVARSLCDHSRIFILCLCDSDFFEYFYAEYTDDEKKERYYKKRETNVSKKLKEIAEKAKKLNNNEGFYVESSIFNLTTDLYEDLTNKLGELSHLSEITLAKELFSTDEKLVFDFSDKQETMKFGDKLIEYFVSTTLTIIVIFIAEDIKQIKAILGLYDFLNFLNEELYKFRNIDKLLIELKNQVKNILTSEDITDNNK